MKKPAKPAAKKGGSSSSSELSSDREAPKPKRKKQPKKDVEKNHDGDGGDNEEVKVPEKMKAAVDKLPEEKKGAWSLIFKTIKKFAKSYAARQAGDLLDELFMGNFKDAVVDVYAKKMESKLEGEDGVKEAVEHLKSFDGWKQGEKKRELSSKKDKETSTNIDPKTAKINVLWYSNHKEENVGYLMSEIVKEI